MRWTNGEGTWDGSKEGMKHLEICSLSSRESCVFLKKKQEFFLFLFCANFFDLVLEECDKKYVY